VTCVTVQPPPPPSPGLVVAVDVTDAPGVA